MKLINTLIVAAALSFPAYGATVYFDDGTVTEVPSSHNIKILPKPAPKECKAKPEKPEKPGKPDKPGKPGPTECPPPPVCPEVPCKSAEVDGDEIIVTDICNGTVTVYNVR